jgi:hypothetical protein
MTLREVIDNLKHFGDDDAIFAERISGVYLPTSSAMVLSLSDEELLMKTVDVAARRCPGLSYVLEVFVAKEAIDVWSEWRSGQLPSPYEALRAVIHYAEFDSYLPVSS